MVLVATMADNVPEVLAFKTHTEYVTRLELQLLLYILDYLGGSRGRQRQHGYVWQQVPYVGYV